MSFVMKRVHASGSLAEDLRELRERAGLSIEQAAQLTKVLPSVIRAWEHGQWTYLSTDMSYVERMVMTYARHFQARETFLRKKFHDECKGLSSGSQTKILAMRPFQGFDVKWSARARAALMVAVFVSGLGMYMGAQAKAIAEPPVLEIRSPEDGGKLDRPVVRVEGKTSPEATVLVNERPASIREDGTFSLELDVPRGATEIWIRAKKRHSREAEAKVRVVYDRAHDAESDSIKQNEPR